MLPASDPYGVRTLDFIEKLQSLDTYEDICIEITKELQWYGFSCVTCMSIPGPGEALENNIYLNTRPSQYVEHYIEKDYVHHDPIVTELHKNMNPYSWTDVRKTRELSRFESNIIDEATEFEVTDGLIIPIATLSRTVSIFSPCGENPDLSPRARSAIELMGVYSYQALNRYLIREGAKEQRTPLTPRERQVLTWVAVGKTDDEIADILSIATSTVTSHVESAKMKLDAFKRTYAVVKALKFGEIHL